MAALSTRLISDISHFAQMRQLWKRLADADPLASLFTSWEWAENWVLQYWQPGYRLHLLVVQRGSTPIGLLPLYYNHLNRAFHFIGSGEPEEAELSSEYLDYLLAEESPALDEAYRFVAACLEGLSRRLVVPNVVPESHLYRTFAFSKHVLSRVTGRQYRLRVADDFGSMLASLSRKERKKAQQSMNRFTRLAELDFQLVQDGRGQDDLWAELRRLHQADWQARGKLGAFHDPRFLRFHLAMQAARPDIRQWYAVLRHEGSVIAINQYYLHRQTLYFYLTGSVKDEHSRLSPGIMLHLLTWAQLSGSGLIYDFLKGGLGDSYKSRLCAAGGPFLTLCLFPPTFRGRSAYFISLSKEVMRHWRTRLRTLLRPKPDK